MKIAVLSPEAVPPSYGGMDRLLEGLVEALRRRHTTDLITLPVDERSFEGIMKGYYDFYHLDLSAYDAVISCKAPAFMANHPIHVLYLAHRMRVFYDLYQPGDGTTARQRRLIHFMDDWALDPRRIPHAFTIGQTVSRRLLNWGGIESTPIHTPTTFQPLPPEPGRHFFAVGRLHPLKRFDLLIEAMKQSQADAELLIAGKGPDEDRLRCLAAGDSRIRFLGHVSEQALREAYASAIATLFTPVGEDLGLITFESFLSGKPVLTTDDAGEPAEIVTDGRTGFICAPQARAIADRLDWMAAHRGETQAMGKACRARMQSVTWERVADTLVEAIDKTPPSPVAGKSIKTFNVGGLFNEDDSRRIRMLVTDNQIIDPPVAGGRLRIWELYRHLPDDFTTTYIGTHDHPGPQARDQWLAPNFREIIMPLTTIHFKAHEVWRRLTGGDATVDVTMPLLLGRCSPAYRSLIAGHLPSADILSVCHPWMFPFLPKVEGLPRIYDSHNCEATLKGHLLSRTLAGRYLARRVEQTERAAVLGTDLTLACSPLDEAEFVRRYHVEPSRVLSAPNGVDCRRLRPAERGEKTALRMELSVELGMASEGPLAVFIGSNYEPNVQGLTFLINELAPALPGLTIAVLGGCCQMWSDQHPGQTPPANIRLCGFVEADRLGDLLRAADLALNPMAVGSGTNIKMLDYMASGLPIVSTPVGARGIEGTPGQHWVQAEPADFAQAVRELIEAPERCAALGKDARALAEERYEWRNISKRLAHTLREMLIHHRRGQSPKG